MKKKGGEHVEIDEAAVNVDVFIDELCLKCCA